MDKFTSDYQSAIQNAKLLVVGAGGIGCELLKNLVMTGFEDIHIVDLDTIDVSNLNRQFLFQKQHVGKPKAVVAKESALKMRPNAKITAYHDSITDLKYGTDFFKQFSAVTNALDNRAARSHVNRMCLAADIPLIESGTSGYKGQVTVHKKSISECYECQPKEAQRTFPGCTIRNTPSEPIHCIVWAKHLFNQLFGEEDADEDVSPDMPDSEPADGDTGGTFNMNESGNIQRKSTREWAKQYNYDHLKLFNKLFREDIFYLLSMENLWKERRAPVPLDWDNLPDAVAGSSQQPKPSMKDQEIWSIKQCASVFEESLNVLKKRAEELSGNDILVWDKDDKHCMNFVTACSNIRAHCFGIPLKSPFDVKALAGNVIPAIATSNAIVAGAIVLQLLKVMKGHYEAAKTVVLNIHTPSRRNLVSSAELAKPNPECYVCSNTSVVVVRLNAKTMTVKTLEEKILKGQLHMIAPDVEIDNGKGTILISSDPEEMEEGVYGKTLDVFNIISTPHLKCDDFFQHFKFVLNIAHDENMPEEKEFEIVSDVSDLQPKEDAMDSSGTHAEGSSQVAAISTDTVVDDEDLEVLEEEDETNTSKKRKHEEDENGVPSESPVKKKSKAFTVSSEFETVDLL